jgi:hypothetical protein
MFEVFGNDVVARKDPSHRRVTVPGHLPLVVYVTRALNVVVARPLLGESIRDTAAKAGKTDDSDRSTKPAMSARRCILLASDRRLTRIIGTLDRQAGDAGARWRSVAY